MDDQRADRTGGWRLIRAIRCIGFTGFLLIVKGMFFSDDIWVWLGAGIFAVSIVGESLINPAKEN
jgi:hypothetical protein